jgi:hypothetical protein
VTEVGSSAETGLDWTGPRLFWRRSHDQNCASHLKRSGKGVVLEAIGPFVDQRPLEQRACRHAFERLDEPAVERGLQIFLDCPWSSLVRNTLPCPLVLPEAQGRPEHGTCRCLASEPDKLRTAIRIAQRCDRVRRTKIEAERFCLPTVGRDVSSCPVRSSLSGRARAFAQPPERGKHGLPGRAAGRAGVAPGSGKGRVSGACRKGLCPSAEQP